jgi:flagellar basal-body rod protein FlgG
VNGLYGVPLAGMQGAEFQLNVIANNIANVNSSGFMAQEPVVDSLAAQAQVSPAVSNSASSATNVGMGAISVSTERIQGGLSLQSTGNPLDLAIEGQGMFVLRHANGQVVYAPEVSLRQQPDGKVVTQDGLSLVPPLRVPANVTGLTVDGKGTLQGKDSTGKTIQVGTPGTATFAAQQNLSAAGGGLYTETLSSGRPQTPKAGSVTVMSGYQLGSNVDLATEMVELIQAQRQFEVSGKALQTVDSLVNNVVSISAR